ncbi:hypothetical protein QBC39DRAFT_94577 [Podospora conica]|nr:hypothetical protein QBC39DRAFT_94577 [Schizothecium conicum]
MAYLGSAFVRRGGIFQDALADKSGETGHELSTEFCCCTCTFANILCGFVLSRGRSKYVGYQLDQKRGWSGPRLELKMLTLSSRFLIAFEVLSVFGLISSRLLLGSNFRLFPVDVARGLRNWTGLGLGTCRTGRREHWAGGIVDGEGYWELGSWGFGRRIAMVEGMRVWSQKRGEAPLFVSISRGRDSESEAHDRILIKTVPSFLVHGEFENQNANIKIGTVAR